MKEPRKLPKINWTPNSEGVRTLGQAIAIAQSAGIQIPNDIAFFVDENLPLNTYAKYFGRVSVYGEEVPWSDFYNRFGFIPLRINPVVLISDEAIVAVFTHEFHELNQLRRIFARAGGFIRAEVLEDLIGLGRPGNLHDIAWELADQAVIAMRGTLR